MVDHELRTHLAQLERPLQYAARHDFVHLAQLRDLERYLQHQLQALQALPLPTAWGPLLQQCVPLVQGFDGLPLPDKQARVHTLRQLLSQMRAALLPAPEVSPAPPGTTPPPTE